MKFSYDPDRDTLFIELAEQREASQEALAAGGACLSLAGDGTILSIKIEHASTRYAKQALERHASYPGEPISPELAARLSGLDLEVLKQGALDGALVVERVGRSWTTTVGAVTAYQQALARVQGTEQ